MSSDEWQISASKLGPILLRAKGGTEAIDEVPLFDEKNGYLYIPSDDFDNLTASRQQCDTLFHHWSERREITIQQLLDIACQLDGWQKGCNISTTVGSGVGIASSAAVIGGLIMMPPVAIGGLIVGGVAAVSNLVTGVAKMVNMKKQASVVKEHLESDQNLLSSLEEEIQKLEEAYDNFMKNSVNTNLVTSGSSNALLVGSVGVGTTIAVGSVGARLALKETVVVSTNVMKGVAHAAAVVSIAIDLVTVIITAKDLANGSRCDLAVQLREIAEKLEDERMEFGRIFVNRFGLANSNEC